ncbi:ubiquitin family protein [Hirsutella rhossiliensis]|uniref:Ubiquitin family domain-containing protein n=1 Tax=Hirsutella rhossiliensis TaxID=111463 RepID=A0A9P8MW81_9HYPO|nr:ubiquitin family domain-containing protein [Hirsutella rhossiliensis]KAH0962334.1 ubiquitin family domain-containing protein [Hirsutella rhossiliensis]
MADNAEVGDSAQVTFKVKTSSDSTHTVTMAESATIFELKTKLSGEDLENIPVERQRLIYSGRVMKNDDTLASYKIKPNNTIHMVKSAASNPTRQPAASTSTPPAVPTNMASGTANNPLAGLTGARYAGHQVNLPGMEMFGPDGGMGPPMDEERLQHMMSDPNLQQAMREALNNPDFVNMLIESNPMLRNMPGARELITSPGVQQMMSNTNMLRDAMRLQRMMGGGDAAFPAPGATDTTPDGNATGEGNANRENGNTNQQNPFMNPFMMPGMMGGGGGGGGGGGDGRINMGQMLQALGMGGSPFAAAPPVPGATQGQGSREGQTVAPGQEAAPTEGAGASPQNQSQQPANPFAALFPPQGGSQNNPFGMNPEMMQQMMQMMGGGAPTSPPADNRPPEERYAEQLRQLNDMGFYDFERNVAALRRSGGSVQGAIEHLLSATD